MQLPKALKFTTSVIGYAAIVSVMVVTAVLIPFVIAKVFDNIAITVGLSFICWLLASKGFDKAFGWYFCILHEKGLW